LDREISLARTPFEQGYELFAMQDLEISNFCENGFEGFSSEINCLDKTSAQVSV